MQLEMGFHGGFALWTGGIRLEEARFNVVDFFTGRNVVYIQAAFEILNNEMEISGH